MELFIETERLYIRPLSSTDDRGMFDMDSDPEVHKYIGNKPVESIAHSRDVIEIIRQQYIDCGTGRCAIVEKATNHFVGWVGFKLTKFRVNGHCDFYDFGYRLGRRFWNKGYATEASKASFGYGVETLHFNDVYAMTDVDNVASRKILEKLGFNYIETFEYDAELTWRKEREPTTWYGWSLSDHEKSR